MSSNPKRTLSAVSALALVLTVWMARSPGVVAEEADARRLLKAMTDYVGAQQVIAFEYDATLEVVTKDRQKLQLASSGMVSLARPDKIRSTRSGGFVDMETVFDGKTLTLFGKNKNVYTRVEAPGTLDGLMNELEKKVLPVPACCRSVPRPCLRRDDGRRDEREGWAAGSSAASSATTSPSAPKTWDWQIWVTRARNRVRAGTSSRPRESPTRRGYRPASELEDRQRGRQDGLRVQAAGRRETDRPRRAQEDEGHGRLPSHFVVGGQ